MAANRFINPRSQFFDSSGDIVSSGKLYFYETGTSTPKDTFADVNQSTLNTNPAILSADGRVPNIFYNGTARVVLTDSADNQIWDVDNVGVAGGDVPFETWSSATEYSEGDIVEASDGYYYRSLTNGNTNLDPTTNPASWERVTFIRTWNTNVVYNVGDVVQDSSGVMYRSLTALNQGNDPTSSPSNWASTAASNWTLAQEVSPTGVSSFQVTGIPSNALRIMIVFSDLDYSTNTRARIQVLDDGVVQTTGYDSTSVTLNNSTSNSVGVSTSTLDLVRISNQDGVTTHSGVGFLTRNASTGRWIWACTGRENDSVTPTNYGVAKADGLTPVIVGDLDGVEFETLSGTFEGGTFSVWYEVE